ncbi:hypothetical protein [Frankia tisae]|uniref:hypothetical protein n=1 Tax=Frankia tisae TaxID=2950104 RepID=UPI0021BED3FB|nr:hypothetical protein [Frankia tisae]
MSNIDYIDEIDLIPNSPIRAEVFPASTDGPAIINLVVHDAPSWLGSAADSRTLIYGIGLDEARTLLVRLAGLIDAVERAAADASKSSQDVRDHPDYAGLTEITTQHSDGVLPEDMTPRDWADLACGLEALLLSQRPHSSV